jgi:hypothetical protein
MSNEQAQERARPSILWWGYFALFVVLFVITSANSISAGFFNSFGVALISAVIVGSDALALVGLYAYIVSKALLSPLFWRVVFLVLVVRVLIAAVFLGSTLFPWERDPEQYVALAGLLSVLFSIPMLGALWVYAFRSPQIWNGR